MRSLLIAGAALALAGCATDTTQTAAAAPEGRDCFRTEDVNGFSVIDDHNLRITVGANRDYVLRTQSNLRALDFSQAIALRSRPSGWVCEGSGAGVELIGGEPLTRTWQVVSITRLPEQPAAG